MKPRGGLHRYRSEAREHLAWCDKEGIRVLGGRWDLEVPLTGLLLAAAVDSHSAPALLGALCGERWPTVQVDEVWCPSALVDVIVNFRVDDARHMLVLEHKHLNTRSHAPGYNSGGGDYWQTESLVRELDRVRSEGSESLLGGPYDQMAQAHLVVLDARGRTMDEAFELKDGEKPHRHELWDVVSYADLARMLRGSFEADRQPALEPLLGQLFASERQ
jgi:hypothetical protein